MNYFPDLIELSDSILSYLSEFLENHSEFFFWLFMNLLFFIICYYRVSRGLFLCRCHATLFSMLLVSMIGFCVPGKPIASINFID